MNRLAAFFIISVIAASASGQTQRHRHRPSPPVAVTLPANSSVKDFSDLSKLEKPAADAMAAIRLQVAQDKLTIAILKGQVLESQAQLRLANERQTINDRAQIMQNTAAAQAEVDKAQQAIPKEKR